MTTEDPAPRGVGRASAPVALPVAVGAGAVAADVVADAAIRALDQSIEIVGPVLRLAPSTNDGIALGLLQGTGPLPIVLGIVGVVVILAIARRNAAEPLLGLALGLMLGGAVANLVERLAFGAVLDYVDMGVGTVRSPTYNVGDVAISLAVLLLIAVGVRGGRRVPASE